MFGFGRKNKVVKVNAKVADTFKEANDKLVDNLTDIQKVQGNVIAIDRDLAKVEQSILLLTQAIAALETRLITLEDQLSVRAIKFTNN